MYDCDPDIYDLKKILAGARSRSHDRAAAPPARARLRVDSSLWFSGSG
jgi:hypothetical protein